MEMYDYKTLFPLFLFLTVKPILLYISKKPLNYIVGAIPGGSVFIERMLVKRIRHLSNVEIGPFRQPTESGELIVLAGPNGSGKIAS